MKFLFSILVLLLTVKECDQKKTAVNETKSEIVNSDNAKQQHNQYIIEYSAITRGTFQEVILNNKTISIQKGRNLKPIVKACSEEVWQSLMRKTDSIDIENLSNLKAPTQKRYYDGAAIANFKVIFNGKEFKTPPFDHGFPPMEIDLLYSMVLEILEDTKKL